MTIRLLIILSGILLCTPGAWARIWYVTPGGTGTACTEASSCHWQTALAGASGNDTVYFKNGTYKLSTGTEGFRTKNHGTSASARLTFQALNRRQAILEFDGNNNAGDTVLVEHDNIIIRGFRVLCKAPDGRHTWDCVQANGTRSRSAAAGGGTDPTVRNVLFDDIYASDSGHQLFGCYLANNIEARNSTFDLAAQTDDNGEGAYLSSCCGKNNPCNNLQFHHNIVARYGENAVDYKDQTLNTVVRDSIFSDQRTKLGGGTAAGDAVWIAQGTTGVGTKNFGNIVRDSISWRGLSGPVVKSSDTIRLDITNVVVMDQISSSGANLVFNGSGEIPQAESYNNISCPSNGMDAGPNLTHGKAANQLNRPMSECVSRYHTILGTTSFASCEIGNVSNRTVVVNTAATKNGPVSTIGTVGQTAVKFGAGVDQTEQSVTRNANNQFHITVANPPNAGQAVTITAPIGVVKNSAFIGGLTCGLPITAFTNDPGGTQRNPNKIVTGEGVCGDNRVQLSISCQNNVGGTGTSTETDTSTDTDTDTDTSTDTSTETLATLDQSVFRFYAEHGAEGANPIGPEQGQVTLPKGKGFRLRIGVRGGGNDSINRTYALASRICSPNCGGWSAVTGDHTGTGVAYQEDQIQINGTETTNQLSIGARTFLPGVFIEVPDDTPAVIIGETHQIEWEFSVEIPTDNNPLVPGDRVEFRVQQNDGVGLNTYSVLPSVTIGSMSLSGGGRNDGGRAE